MKHLLFCTFFSTFSVALNAQLNKAQWLVGGSAAFTYTANNNNNGQSTYSNKSTGLTVSPGAGYFFMDKLCAGIRPGIATSTSTVISTFPFSQGSESSTSKSTSTNWSIAPFVRYYFLPKKNKVNLLAECGFAYGHDKLHLESTNVYTQNGLPTVNNSSSNYTYNIGIYSISAGPAIFLNPKVALEFTAGYSIYSSKLYGSSQNTVTLGAGFQIYLDGKKG